MWPHKDLGWWGFWISIFTFFAAVPLGVTANLLAPKIQNWWAGRSREALRRRIAELEAELIIMSNAKPISETADFMFNRIDGLEYRMFRYTFLIVYIGLVAISAHYIREHRLVPVLMFGFLAVIGYVLGAMELRQRPRYFDEFRSPTHERETIEALGKLKQKLEKHG
jgi:hypothetical protein